MLRNSQFSKTVPAKHICSALVLISSAGSLLAADLTIHVSGTAPISRTTVHYQCDSAASKMGAPSGPFSVEYINGGETAWSSFQSEVIR